MNSARTDAYLSRIGAERPVRATAQALRDLQLRQLRTVPFENLSIHLGEDIVLAEQPLLDKVVDARRGGFCYELNGAFGILLAGLGFEVTLLQGRVFGPEGKMGIPYDHMALRVRDADGGLWLVDVGFGENSQVPLAFDERGEQPDPAGTFRLVDAPEGDLDVLKEDGPGFRLDLRPRVLADFAAGAWWHRTSPESPFTQSLICSRLTEDGRITLSGRTVKTTGGAAAGVQELGSDAAWLAACREHFGIVLDVVPEVALNRARGTAPGTTSERGNQKEE